MARSNNKPRAPAPAEFASIFGQLRAILAKHADRLAVIDDTPTRYCLEGKTGPATARAWGGKTRRAAIPVAWAEISKSYVSFHLMPAYGNPALHDRMSENLKGRMQGKSCFNFTSTDETLFHELDQLTAEGLAAFKRAGFVV